MGRAMLFVFLLAVALWVAPAILMAIVALALAARAAWERR
jgi:hypothetical protein